MAPLLPRFVKNNSWNIEYSSHTWSSWGCIGGVGMKWPLWRMERSGRWVVRSAWSLKSFGFKTTMLKRPRYGKMAIGSGNSTSVLLWAAINKFNTWHWSISWAWTHWADIKPNLMQRLSISCCVSMEILDNILKGWQWRRKDDVIWRKEMAGVALCIFQSNGFGEWLVHLQTRPLAAELHW